MNTTATTATAPATTAACLAVVLARSLDLLLELVDGVGQGLALAREVGFELGLLL